MAGNFGKEALANSVMWSRIASASSRRLRNASVASISSGVAGDRVISEISLVRRSMVLLV